MHRLFLTAVATLFATAALAAPFPSPTLYPSFSNAHGRGTFETFGVSGSEGLSPAAINANGTVAGYYIYNPTEKRHSYEYHAFYRTADGTLTLFNAPNAAVKKGGSLAFGINAAGDIAGEYVNSNGVTHGYLRFAGGTFIKFDPAGSIGTFVTGINDNDSVIGDYYNGTAVRGFVRTSDGTFTTFEMGNGDGSERVTVPAAINDAGTITGSFENNEKNRAFVRTQDGTVAKFGVPSSTGVDPVAINTAGVVAGIFVTSAGVNVGFLRAPDGTITRIKVPNASTTAGQGTFVAGLNDKGQVTGHYFGSDKIVHGFTRSAGGTIKTFDVYSPTGTYPVGINATGTITGFSGQLGFVWSK